MNSETSKVKMFPVILHHLDMVCDRQILVLFPNPYSSRLSFQSNLSNLHSFLVTCATNIYLVPSRCQTFLHTRDISVDVAENALCHNVEEEKL